MNARNACFALLLAVVTPSLVGAQCLIMGTYRSVPALHYSCAFGEIDWTVVDWLFQEIGPGELWVTTIPGPLVPMYGTIDCATSSFQVTSEEWSPCLQGYMLSGQIVSLTHWVGTFSAGFPGACYDCTGQQWSVAGSFGTGIEPPGGMTWSTIKALYR